MKKIALSLLCLALLPVGTLGQSLPPEVIGYADTVLYNGKIVTVDSLFSIAQNHECVSPVFADESKDVKG